MIHLIFFSFHERLSLVVRFQVLSSSGQIMLVENNLHWREFTNLELMFKREESPLRVF